MALVRRQSAERYEQSGGATANITQESESVNQVVSVVHSGEVRMSGASYSEMVERERERRGGKPEELAKSISVNNKQISG